MWGCGAGEILFCHLVKSFSGIILDLHRVAKMVKTVSTHSSVSSDVNLLHCHGTFIKNKKLALYNTIS